MTTGQRIYEARRKAGMTQEELADRLGVSRQAVSKWESDTAFPETEKILELCRLFHFSADELLFGEEREGVRFAEQPAESKSKEDGKGETWGVIRHEGKAQFEYVSKIRLGGIPLLHINFGICHCRAKGIVAIGNIATGVLSAGFLSVGLVSWGLLSVGLLAFGSIALGFLLAAAGVAIGTFAFGGVAIGVICFGGCAVGYFAVGGAAIGQYTLGDWAQGWLAVGLRHANGAHAFIVPDMLGELGDFLEANVSGWFGRLVQNIARTLGG